MYDPTIPNAILPKTGLAKGQPFTAHNIEKHLREVLASDIRRDQEGKAALAAVLAICPANPVPLSSRRKRTLAKLGKGWTTDGSAGLSYLVSPEGSRIFIPAGILDAANIAAHNTWATAGAERRLSKADVTAALIPVIARQMEKIHKAKVTLYRDLEGLSSCQFEPWQLLAFAFSEER